MRVSLVTPCYNKAPYLEAALRSVLDQRYADLEYGVVDGGSTDGSREILERHADRLAFVIREADAGMYDALAKGFARSNGEIMGYLGADDLHLPWTLAVVTEVFSTFPEVEWLTSLYPLTADARGIVLKARKLSPPCAKAFFRGANLAGMGRPSAGWIQQESTFWRRTLWDRCGGFDSALKRAGDFDLWCRFMRQAEPVGVTAPLAVFRRHGDQISSTQAAAYAQEALESLRRYGGTLEPILSARGRAALNGIGLGTRGRTATFDFVKGMWCLS